jgi:hypothetical protein
MHLQPDPLLRRLQGDAVGGLLDQGSQVHRPPLQPQLTGLRQGEEPQVLHQPGQVPHLVVDLDDLFRHQGKDAIQQRLQLPLQDPQGGAELVGDVRQHLTPLLLRPGQRLRHLIERPSHLPQLPSLPRRDARAEIPPRDPPGRLLEGLERTHQPEEHPGARPQGQRDPEQRAEGDGPPHLSQELRRGPGGALHLADEQPPHRPPRHADRDPLVPRRREEGPHRAPLGIQPDPPRLVGQDQAVAHHPPHRPVHPHHPHGRMHGPHAGHGHRHVLKHGLHALPAPKPGVICGEERGQPLRPAPVPRAT